MLQSVSEMLIKFDQLASPCRVELSKLVHTPTVTPVPPWPSESPPASEIPIVQAPLDGANVGTSVLDGCKVGDVDGTEVGE